MLNKIGYTISQYVYIIHFLTFLFLIHKYKFIIRFITHVLYAYQQYIYISPKRFELLHIPHQEIILPLNYEL